MPRERRKTIYSQPPEASTPAKKARTDAFTSTPMDESPFKFHQDAEELLAEDGAGSSSPYEDLDDPQFDAGDDHRSNTPLYFYNLEDGIPPGLDPAVLNEVLEAMNFPAEDWMSEGEDDDPEEMEIINEDEELSWVEEISQNMMPTEKPKWHEKPPREEGDEEDEEEEEEEEIEWGRTYTGQLDGGVDINWSVDPPSTHEAQTYALPSRAPKQIKLAKKFGYMKGERNPEKFLNLVLTEELLNRIMHYTNKYAISILGDNWKKLDMIEMRAFIGALVYIGERGLGHMPWDDLFRCNTYKVNIPLKRAISRDRFKEIMRFMRFDDKVVRTAETEKNRLAKIEKVFDRVVKNSRKLFKPSKVIVVDETMVSYRGGVAFKQYNPANPDPYAMKVFSACDGITGALLNAQVYTGKKGEEPEVGQGKRVVLDLLKPYFGSGRIVVTDRFYTSIGLAQELRANGLEFLGTMMENRKGLPKQFKHLDLHQHYNGKPPPKPKKSKKKKRRGRNASKKSSVASKKSKTGGKSKNGHLANGAGNRGSPIRLRLTRREDSDYHVGQRTIDAAPMPTDPIEESINTVIKESAPPPPSPAKKGRKRKADAITPIYTSLDPKSAFLFSDHLTVVRYEPKAGKHVTLLSTIHHEPAIRNDRKAKPKIILTYNKDKYAVDLMDQMAKNYSTVRTARRWPMRMFFWLLDVAIISAYIAYKIANPDLDEKDKSRRLFHQRLAIRLMKPNIRRRENDPRLRHFTHLLSKAVLGTRQLERSCDAFLDESVPIERTKELAETPSKRITKKADVFEGKINRRNAPNCYVKACAKPRRKAYKLCSICDQPVCPRHSEAFGDSTEKKIRCSGGEATCVNK